MTRENNVVGVLRTSEILAIIQALEPLEQQAQAIVDRTPGSELNDEWERWQGIAVDVRNALGMFRRIVAPPTPHKDSAWTIRWEPGGFSAAVIALTGQPEVLERREWDE